jgi:putative ABC transport system permease protein
MKPPRIPVRLLQLALPSDVREDITGDLEEVYARKLRAEGARRARVWYAREAVALSLRFGLERWLLRRVRPERSSLLNAVSVLDFKLGMRMLVRYPGLTLIGGLAMGFAIWLGAGAFETIRQIGFATLPLPEGDRIVAIHNLDVSAARPKPVRVHDVLDWQTSLTGIEEVSAFRQYQRNLLVEGRGAEPVDVAEITATGLRAARVAPLLGRLLLPEDERADAAPVAVIGYDVWQDRFDGEANVLGRTVGLGGTTVTIVGVMPAGFEFPVAQSLWIPLRLDAIAYPRGDGPSLTAFGRLAEGVSLAEAQLELTTVGARTSAAYPDTHRHVRPRVTSYTAALMGISPRDAKYLLSSNLFLVILVVLICGNVALLMFARAATRESEIVVRSALGASRGRIITQLFAEALVLGTLAAALGLAAAGYGLRWALHVAEIELNGGRLPFWFEAKLSPVTIFYALLLTLLGAAVAGVLPALKATRQSQSGLRAATSSGWTFGGVWTAVIVSQVAVTVAFPMTTYLMWRDIQEVRTLDVGFTETEYLAAQLALDPETTADTSRASLLTRFEQSYRALERRLEAEPEVTAVTYADRLPRTYHPHRLLEIDAGGAAPLRPQWPGYRVSNATVDPEYFQVLGAPVLQGRGFRVSDVASDAPVAVVNESFVELVLGGRNPIGRRFRYTYFEEWEEPRPEQELGPWHEIVGVVPDLGTSVGDWDPKRAAVYHPGSPVTAYPARIAIHLRGDVASFAPRLRRLALAVDPALRVMDPKPMERLHDSTITFLEFWFQLLLVVSALALLLSLTGIYSVMSFTVARRTREIGIRVALGAPSVRVLPAILRRPLMQVGFGIGAGAVLTGALVYAMAGVVTARGVALLGLYALSMMGVCLLACAVPTRRALKVHPIHALRADA